MQLKGLVGCVVLGWAVLVTPCDFLREQHRRNMHVNMWFPNSNLDSLLTLIPSKEDPSYNYALYTIVLLFPSCHFHLHHSFPSPHTLSSACLPFLFFFHSLISTFTWIIHELFFIFLYGSYMNKDYYSRYR